MDRRKPGQSQLDYLWVTFGNYTVSSNLKEEDSIPTSELVSELLESVKKEAIHSLKIVGSRLIGYSISGTQIVSIDLPSASGSITDFGKRQVTAEDVANGCHFKEGQTVYYIEMGDGSLLMAEAEDSELVTRLSVELKELKTTVIENANALSIINSEDENQVGSLKNTLKLSKDYIDQQLLIINEKLDSLNVADVLSLKEQVEDNTAKLLILSGPADQEGSILNIVSNNIQSALNWQEI